MKSKAIRVLMFEDKAHGSGWSAQCLDCDIAMQAKSFQDLIYEINRVLIGHVVVSKELGIEPFGNITHAPPVYWQLFDQAKTTVMREAMPFGPEDAAASDVSEVLAKVAELQPAV